MNTDGETFATDTNMIRNPSSRRLLHGIALETEHTISVLPEVAHELIGKRNCQIAQCEEERWWNRHPDATDTESISETLLAVKAAAVAYCTEMFAMSPFQLRTIEHDHVYLSRLLRSLPQNAFQRDTLGIIAEGDPLIVAEAIVLNILRCSPFPGQFEGGNKVCSGE